MSKFVNECCIILSMDFYHVYNRGVEGRKIFNNKSDVSRFDFGLKAFNTKDPIGGIYQVNLKKNIDVGCLYLNPDARLVNLVAYCLNPTHYHLLIGVDDLSNLSEYLKRVNGGYTKYFNNRYDRSGVLFQGKTKRKLITNNNYLQYVASYILGNREVHQLDEQHLGHTSFDKGLVDEFNFNSNNFVNEAKKLGLLINQKRKSLQGLELEKI